MYHQIRHWLQHFSVFNRKINGKNLQLDDIKIFPKEIGYENVNWILMTQDKAL